MRSLVQLLLTVLLNASWQITVVTVFAACGSWLLRDTAAWCRHTVWVAAILISLCLPIIGSLNALGFSPTPKQKVARIEPERNIIRPFSPQEIDSFERTMPSSVVPIVEPTRQSGWSSPISLNRNLAAVLVAVYVFFFLFRSFKLLWAWRRTAVIVRSAYSMEVSGRAAAIIAKCQTSIGVTRVRVVCSASVPVPITAGVFNPLIILPVQLLNEADDAILLSAIGHELVHVVRRDYVLNLVYELIYLPLSFHPAAAVLRRRIKQTRELCCDELVAKKLLAPEVYARSLVRLIGSVPLAGRLAPDTTIGITDADILEVRIMSLLKTSQLSKRRNTLLLIAACLLLAAPCVAAAAFAVQFDIADSQPAISQHQESGKETSQKLERADQELQRAREGLQRKERELAERVRKNPNPQGAELETIHRMERELEEASAKLSHEEATVQLNGADQVLRQSHATLTQMIANYPADEARMREAREKLELLQRSMPENEERMREVREQLAMMEKEYSNVRLTNEQLQSIRRAQEDVVRAQETLTQEQREKVEDEQKLKEERLERLYREALEKGEVEDREGKNKISSKEYEKLIRKEIDGRVRKEVEEAEREGRGKEQFELTQLATISMDQAIQTAVSKHPGKVLSCSLGRQKDGQVFYRLVIISGDGDKSSATYVWVSATDGRILKTEHE